MINQLHNNYGFDLSLIRSLINSVKYSLNPILSTEVSDEDYDKGWIDENGVIYSKDKFRLLSVGEAQEVLDSYKVLPGTKVICDYAFFESNLQSVILPDSVTHIGEHAFDCCMNLKSIRFPKSLRVLSAESFISCGFESIEMPEGLIEVGSAAFENCESLRSVKFNDKLESLDCTFRFCKSLKHVVLPESLSTIGWRLFEGCESLESVFLPRNLIRIDDNPFVGCKRLKQISCATSSFVFSDNALYTKDKTRIISYLGTESHPKLPNSLVEIGGSAFSHCDSLQSIFIPKGVKMIEDDAFSECEALNEITIPNSVTRIGASAFSGCIALKSICVPESVDEVDFHAFGGCSSLQSITFLGHVKHFGVREYFDGVFLSLGCPSLKSIYIPKGSYSYYVSLLPDERDKLCEF